MPSGIYPRAPKNHVCAACDSTITINWHCHDEHWYCNPCFLKYIRNPARLYQEYRKNYAARRLLFQNTRLILDHNPRKGVCSECGKINGEIFINTKGKESIVQTHIHHVEYDSANPLNHIVELCEGCHLRESIRLRQF
jgi:5-methylcytosine-specific restriction endonuclease McrA